MVHRSWEGILEIWGGAEYTCNRVGDKYFDQMTLSGHDSRASDLELFAKCGIKALRCGLLWERFEKERSWQWTDAYLTAMREARLRPIAGLVHHGSGPPSTSLLDPDFAPQLAAYAGQCAERYPWIGSYTPVNEPHTTARFSGRYGTWYPHHQSERSYLRALVNEVKGTVLSMQAIRAVRSDAELVQTDDLGRCWSTPELTATADVWNERRWLAFDLLCGRVDRTHPLFNYLIAGGVGEHEVLWFRDNPSPPAVIGVNYYVTSDRYLDHRIGRYPEHCRSAEGPFADVEAVRIRQDGIQGFRSILEEAFYRYSLPVALTEVHLGAEIGEQIRWVATAWHDTLRARQEGIPCAGFTFWALLGSYFWDNLVTFDNGHYESGVFDLRSGQPEPTPLVAMVEQCARGASLEHPALSEEGWWMQSCQTHPDPDVELEPVAEEYAAASLCGG